MPRPVKPRWVEFNPGVTYLKPVGIPMRDLKEVRLGIDEVEALRLKDLVGLEQEQCAERMKIAQSTFQRILTSARNKVAMALIEGRAVRVEGGNYLISPVIFKCAKCGSEWRNEDPSISQPICPNCGSKEVTAYRLPPEPQEMPGRHRGRRFRRGNGY